MFDSAIAPIVEEVLQGFNCTVFAYGQTGTGKTYTMEGERDEARWTLKQESDGVIPRAVRRIFETLEANGAEYNIRVSLLEIYNEELTDLVADSAHDITTPNAQKLKIFEDPSGRKGQLVQGLEEVCVTTVEEVMAILDRSGKQRKVAETLMNKHSSRSHTIFSIVIHIKETTSDGEELLKIGKLNLVDLAGSECIGRSGAINLRAKEAGSINQSLLTLGRVITALVDHCPHVPYRESKLTRLLQDSLGGKTKTCVIATVSPSVLAVDETLSTLDYAHRAKSIKNKPEVNAKMTKRTLIREYGQEIAHLTALLHAAREKNGIYLPKDEYEGNIAKIQSQEAQIEQLERDLAARQQELADITRLFAVSQEELKTERSEHAGTKVQLGYTTERLRETEADLADTREVVADKEAVVAEWGASEAKLASEAEGVVRVLEGAKEDVEGLHAKVARKAEVEAHNANATEQLARMNALAEARVRTEAAGARQACDEALGRASTLVGEWSRQHRALLDGALGDLEREVCGRGQAGAEATKAAAQASLAGVTQAVRDGDSEAETVSEATAQKVAEDRATAVALIAAVSERVGAWEDEVKVRVGEMLRASDEARLSAEREAEAMRAEVEALRSEMARITAQQAEQIAAAGREARERREREEAAAKADKEELLRVMSAAVEGFWKARDSSARAEHDVAVAEEAKRAAGIAEISATCGRASDLAVRNLNAQHEAAQRTQQATVAASKAFEEASLRQGSLTREAVQGVAAHLEAAHARTEGAAQEAIRARSEAVEAATRAVDSATFVIVDAVEGIAAGLKTSGEALTATLNEGVTAIQTLSLGFAEATAEIGSATAKLADAGSDAVSELSGMVSTFAKDAVRKDVPTGATPVKRNIPVLGISQLTRARPEAEIVKQRRDGMGIAKSGDEENRDSTATDAPQNPQKVVPAVAEQQQQQQQRTSSRIPTLKNH